MRAARYPLAAVRMQRDHARQAAEVALREARDRMRDAEVAYEAARATCVEQAQRRSAILHERPEQDSAQDLTRNGAYAARLRIEGKRLAQQLRAAQAILAEQARAVRLAELALNQAYAEREALERHHERFREAERKAAERAYELEAEERAQRPDARSRTQ